MHGGNMKIANAILTIMPDVLEHTSIESGM